MLVLGILAAVASSCLYNLSIAMQALQAREVPPEHGLRPSLLVRLVKNPRWLGATGIGLLGWPLELAALLLAPLTVVQPVLASGLLLLLYLGASRLGERPGPREFVAIGAILLGLTGVALAAPRADHRARLPAALADLAGGDRPDRPAAPPVLRGRVGAGRVHRRDQRRLRLRLDGDRQQAGHRRGRGGVDRDRARLARHPGRLPSSSPCSAR